MSESRRFIIPFTCSLIICTFSLSLAFLTTTTSVPTTSKTFVYEWPSWAGVMIGGQRIINGTLRLEITFESTNDSVDITVKINDDDYNGYDFLGLVFDMNRNDFIDLGLVDYPRMLFASNLTYYRNHSPTLQKDGTIFSPVEMPPMHSFCHNCSFRSDIGYTFSIRFSKSELSSVKANMAYVYFYDRDVLSHTSEWEWSPWVSVMIEGWQ